MKQLIVLIATIVLGVSLAGVVNEMGSNVDTIAGTANSAVTEVLTSGTAISK